MSYAFSNYKLQLPVTGTEAGTWGDIVNTNMGSTSVTYQGIEQAIGGKSDVTCSSATTTLAYSDTTGNQNFRSLYLNCTGSPGAAATLVVPAIQKMYVVYNGTSGGYALTVKIGASTGTTIPNGKTMIVYANGTDVIPFGDYFSSLTSAAGLSVAADSTLSGSLSVGTSVSTNGTYGRSTNTVTVTTATAHGLSTGQILYFVFSAGTGGTATDGAYSITVTNALQFTITDTASGNITGSPAVTYIKYNNTTTLATPFLVPAAFGSAGTTGQFLVSQGASIPPKWQTLSSLPSLSISGTLSVSGATTLEELNVNKNTQLGSAETVLTGCTYSIVITTATITKNSHGLSNGDVVTIVFTAGTGTAPTDGNYTVANAATNTFDITVASGTGTGTAVVYDADIVYINSQLYDSTDSAGTTGQTLISQGANRPPLWSSPVALAGGGVDKIVVNTTSPNSISAVAGTGSTTYPASFNRAFVNFNPRGDRQTVSGTYVWATTTLTVTSAAHGFQANDIVWLYFTSGAAFAETYFYWYRITSVTTDTFTINTSTASPGGGSWSLSTTGNVQYFIINPSTLPDPAYNNVRRVCVGIYYGYSYGVENFNEYAILFNTAAPSTSYAWTGSSGNDIANSTSGYGNFISQPYYYASQKSFWKSTKYLLVGAYFDYNGPTSYTQSDISVVVTF